jgi:flagellin
MQTSAIGAFVSETSDVGSIATGTATGDGALLTGGALSTSAGTYTGVSSAAISGGGDVTINGTNVLGSANYAVNGDTFRAGASAYAKAAAINATGVSGVTAQASTELTFTDLGSDTFLDATNIGGTDTLAYSLQINNVTIYDPTTQIMNATTNSISITDAITAINAQQFSTGVVASADSSGNLLLTAADGRDIEVDESFRFVDAAGADDSDGAVATVFGSFTVGDTAATADETYDQAALTFRGQVTLNSNADISIGSGNTVIGFSVASLAATSSLEAQSVLTAANANSAIQSVDSALTAVSNLRSTFGAIQNRFESVVSNLESVAENLTASRSRILDADFAAETAALTRAQVLQQAGVAMLAQANSAPQNVLALLQ